MERISMKSKKEIILAKKYRYRRSSKEGKGKILDSLVDTTGLSRKHITRVLNGSYEYEPTVGRSARGRKHKYGVEHKDVLLRVWHLLGHVCSVRLKASLKDTLKNLVDHQVLDLPPQLIKELEEISASTIGRMLKYDRAKLHPLGISTTKPGSLLKHQIPIRRGSDWDDAVPGFTEIDLVAHCGSKSQGEYINTLDCTDVSSTWTECRAVLNKSRFHTLNAMEAIRQRLPFPLLGIDSDNGSEFINDHFVYYAREHNLVLTRSRANTSNDSCYVEQKNWSVVRKAVGYARFEGQEMVDLLNEFYEQLSLFNNFFLSSQKLMLRERDGGKVRKKHDQALTPFRRLLMDPKVSDDVKTKLLDTFSQLNLFEIRTRMDNLLEKIHALSIRY